MTELTEEWRRHAREVRRILIGAYELRYDIRSDIVTILRIWHTREKR